MSDVVSTDLRRPRSTLGLVRDAARAVVRRVNEGLLALSYRFNSPIAFGGPTTLMVEPSAACNLRCPLCPTGRRVTRRRSSTLSLELFRRALGPFRYTLRQVTFWNWGEPFLNRDLPRMIAYASAYGIETQVSTNGHFLLDGRLDEILTSGLTRLIVSIDTPDRAIYGRYRVGGDFDTVVTGVLHAVRRRDALGSKTAIIVQYMIMRENENIALMLEHAESLGADHAIIKTLGIGSAVEEPSAAELNLLPADRRYWRQVSLTDASSRAPWGDTRCTYIWGRMVLSADGSCLPCCRDQLSKFNLGSVAARGTLASVWNSAPYRRYRRSIRATQRRETMCRRCPELVRQKIEPGHFDLRRDVSREYRDQVVPVRLGQA